MLNELVLVSLSELRLRRRLIALLLQQFVHLLGSRCLRLKQHEPVFREPVLRYLYLQLLQLFLEVFVLLTQLHSLALQRF